MYEDSWQPNERLKFSTKMTPLQKLCTFNYSVWLSNVVLQQSTSIVSFKDTGKTSEMSCLIDSGAFKIAPTFSIKAIARLIPIHLHLQKLSGRS